MRAETQSLTSTKDFAQLLHFVFGCFKETLFQLYERVRREGTLRLTVTRLQWELVKAIHYLVAVLMIFKACVVVHKAIKFLVALVLLLSLHVYINPEISFFFTLISAECNCRIFFVHIILCPKAQGNCSCMFKYLYIH